MLSVTQINLLMQIPSAFSIVGSLVMILSYSFFINIRKLKYFEIVFYIAINDFIASIG